MYRKYIQSHRVAVTGMSAEQDTDINFKFSLSADIPSETAGVSHTAD